MQLTDDEINFLNTLVEEGGETTVSGDEDHRNWERLVGAGYVKRQSADLDSVIYTITHAGRDQLV